jgi:hypothetical protein
MILTDNFPLLLYFVLSYYKDTARILPVAESQTLFPDLVTHLPKVVLADGSIDSLRPQNVVDPSKTVSPRILRTAQGLRMSAFISLSTREVLQLPKSSFV